MTKSLFTNPIHLSNGLDLGLFCNSEDVQIFTAKDNVAFDSSTFTQPDLTFFDEMVNKIVDDNDYNSTFDHTLLSLDMSGKTSGDESGDSTMSLLNTLNDSGFGSKYFSNIWSPTQDDQVIADVPSFLTTTLPSPSQLGNVASISPAHANSGASHIHNNISAATLKTNLSTKPTARRLYDRVSLCEDEKSVLPQQPTAVDTCHFVPNPTAFTFRQYSIEDSSEASMLARCLIQKSVAALNSDYINSKMESIQSTPPFPHLQRLNVTAGAGKAILGSSRKQAAAIKDNVSKASSQDNQLYSRPLLGSNGMNSGLIKQATLQQQSNQFARVLSQNSHNFTRLHGPPLPPLPYNVMRPNSNQPFFPNPNFNQQRFGGYMPSPHQLHYFNGAPMLPNLNAHSSAISAIYRQNNKKTHSCLTLQFHLEECFSQFKSLEKERKKCEAELARKYPGKNLCSNNNVNVPMLSPNPSRIDRMIVDHWKEHSKIMTLLSKMQNLHNQSFPRGMANKIEVWVNSIRIVQHKRREEIETGQMNRFTMNNIKLGMPIVGNQITSPKKFQDDRDILALSMAIKDLGRATKVARTTLWTALTLTVEFKNTMKAIGDVQNFKQHLANKKSESGWMHSQVKDFYKAPGKDVQFFNNTSHASCKDGLNDVNGNFMQWFDDCNNHLLPSNATSVFGMKMSV